MLYRRKEASFRFSKLTVFKRYLQPFCEYEVDSNTENRPERLRSMCLMPLLCCCRGKCGGGGLPLLFPRGAKRWVPAHWQIPVLRHRGRKRDEEQISGHSIPGAGAGSCCSWPAVPRQLARGFHACAECHSRCTSNAPKGGINILQASLPSGHVAQDLVLDV